MFFISLICCYVSVSMKHNGRVLGEVALCVGFERWKAILPNTCYSQCFLKRIIKF